MTVGLQQRAVYKAAVAADVSTKKDGQDCFAGASLKRTISKDTVSTHDASFSTTDEDGTLADLSEIDVDTEEEWDDQRNTTNEPRAFEERLNQQMGGTSGTELVDRLAKVFEHMFAEENTGQITPFHSSRVPPISVLDYFVRIHRYSQCSDACLVMSLVYIDRLVKMRPHFKLSKSSCHRMVAVSLVLAVKQHDDIYYSNAYYAKVIGMTVRELNVLEAHFIGLVDWRVHVSAEEFERYLLAVVPTVRNMMNVSQLIPAVSTRAAIA